MKNVFIDCGSHYGEGYEEFKTILGIDNSWDVYMFEPNRICFDKLQKYTSNNIKIYNKAVWNEDSKMIFRAEKAGNTNKFDGVCSTLLSNDDYYFNYGQESYEVDTIDLAKFLMQFTNEEKIHIKMDIEGAEFETIRNIIDTGSINKICYLSVEWHSWAMTDKEKYKKIEDGMIEEIKQNYKNVDLQYWK